MMRVLSAAILAMALLGATPGAPVPSPAATGSLQQFLDRYNAMVNRLGEVYAPYCAKHGGGLSDKGTVVGWSGPAAYPAVVKCKDGHVVKALMPSPAP